MNDFVPVQCEPSLDFLVRPFSSQQAFGGCFQGLLVFSYEELCILAQKTQLLWIALVNANVFCELWLKSEVGGRIVDIIQDGVDSYRMLEN